MTIWISRGHVSVPCCPRRRHAFSLSRIGLSFPTARLYPSKVYKSRVSTFGNVYKHAIRMLWACYVHAVDDDGRGPNLTLSLPHFVAHAQIGVNIYKHAIRMLWTC